MIMSTPKNQQWFQLLLLILSGEAVFAIPFVLPRVFRPTVLEAFELDNTELGLCFTAYGITAMASYFFGGPLADRFAPRKLIAIALWLTSIGGFVYAFFPGFLVLQGLYAFWGFTTIFLFWAPMIKATRIWGGKWAQGRAYGFLDGGRGLAGALLGSLGVWLFAFFISEGATSFEDKQEAFRAVILVTTLIVALTGAMVWLFLKSDTDEDRVATSIRIREIKEAIRLPAVWMLMLIILCAYVGYKVTDVISLYAQEVMLFDEVGAAQIGSHFLYARFIVGIGIGVIADRSNIVSWLLIGFVLTTVGSIFFALGVASSALWLFYLSVTIVATGVYATRALYFAVMRSGQVPLVLTGTVVGLASLVGFTPDVFAGVLIGVLLDAKPGEAGHQDVFWVLVVFSLIGGLVATRYYLKFGRNQ
ncbi:MAG: MFS transporter [Ekhidna sp.]